ncbi:putative pyrroloquinoline-quinone binding quinoprotein [Kribbella antiqua]|uniref:Putative pyrroloquinoline-quinone binding quinoprotein n=2 Tax=Kribbella antiqua TaxID=2512217 RepID=A0A4R2IKL5_9ACTN|nr:putative pyrroloquinoline-quinone binding quinoprotein [Kribbella antiqua]
MVAVALVLGGCSATESSSPSAPVTTSAAPETKATYIERRQAVIPVTNGDGLVAAAGAVWVKTDDGRVVRIDPATNRVTGEIKIDTTSDENQYCQGIGADSSGLWACATADDGTGVAQIDPNTRRIVRRVAVGKVFDQLTLPLANRGLWVLTSNGTQASVVESGTAKVTGYPLGARCLQLAAKDDFVVATSSTEGKVIALDATSGAVTAQASLPAPRIAVLASTGVWVDTDDGLTHLTGELAVRTVYRNLRAGAGGDLVAAGDTIFVRAPDGTITKIEPNTGRVVEQITPDEPLTAGSLLVAFGSLWTTSSDEGTVTRLRLA